MNGLKEKIDKRIWRIIKDYFYLQRIADTQIIQNINYSSNNDQKKVLICYLTFSFLHNWEDAKIGRTQTFEILKIVNLFSAFGFSIDIVAWNDIKVLDLVKSKKYYLIFGFGETFYQMTTLQPEAISILYMTENHPEFSYQEEKKRLDYYYSRHGKKLKLTRSGKFYKLHQFSRAYSHVISLGETSLLCKQYSDPYFIFPTGLINPTYNFKSKDHIQARKNFIWLGSTGALHKGLDLLLDIFNQRDDIVLHICGLEKKEKRRLKVPIRKNIIDYGHIDINSNVFLGLIEKCSFIILPSCSEASSTSITTGMLHGLIPAVTKDAGFNRLGKNAIFLEDFHLSYLGEKIDEISNLDPVELDNFSHQVYDYARRTFTIQVFEDNFRNIIQDILKSAL